MCAVSFKAHPEVGAALFCSTARGTKAELTQPERRRLEFEVIQSVSRACIPDHLVIQNKVEVFIGIYFYQMILSPYLEGFRISKFLTNLHQQMAI